MACARPSSCRRLRSGFRRTRRTSSHPASPGEDQDERGQGVLVTGGPSRASVPRGASQGAGAQAYRWCTSSGCNAARRPWGGAQQATAVYQHVQAARARTDLWSVTLAARSHSARTTRVPWVERIDVVANARLISVLRRRAVALSSARPRRSRCGRRLDGFAGLGLLPVSMSGRAPSWAQTLARIAAFAVRTAAGVTRYRGPRHVDEAQVAEASCRLWYAAPNSWRVEDQDGAYHVQDSEWTFLRDHAGRMQRLHSPSLGWASFGGHPTTRFGDPS